MPQQSQNQTDSQDDRDSNTTGSEAGAESPHLDEGEKDQAASHSSPHALIIHEIVREEGEAALARKNDALAWSALAAGLSMGFSFLTMAVIRAALPTSSWSPLIDSFGYAIGFIIVVLGKQQLFTESTLTVVLPLLTRRDLSTLLSALRVWAIVLPVNLVGTAIFAALMRTPGVFDAEVVRAMTDIAKDTVAHTFAVTFTKALLAGWLIALMVWLLPGARSARLFVILLITYVVSLTKLSHVIAGSVESLFGVMSGVVSLHDYGWKFLLPTLLGNVLGGISLVGVLNHAAIAPEIGESQQK